MSVADLISLAIGGAIVRFKVIVHGDAVASLSGVRVSSVERTVDSVAFEVEIDGVSTLIRLGDLLSVDVIDVDISTA